MNNDKDILILGAGPAGMATAMELSRAGQIATIIEKDSKVGGLAQTHIFKEGELEFRTDIGPHRFFSKNKYLYDFIEDLLHEKWIRVPRQTRQLIEGKYYDYPIKPVQAFLNIGLFRSIKMVLSYFLGVIKYRIFKKPINSFEDYIVANFGYALGNFNMLNYTEKIWGLSCQKLHPDWAKQRIKGLDLVTALKNALFGGGQRKAKSLVDEFYYPEFGTGLIYETIASRIKDKGFEIKLESEPVKINHSNGTITSIEMTHQGEVYSVMPKTVVSSIPVTHFLSLLNPLPREEVVQACQALSWRAQVYLFITLDRVSVTKDNWIYIPDSDVPFGRVSEMKNFSSAMSPADKTSFFLEFFVNEGDTIWNLNAQELFDLSITHIERLGLFKRSEVRKFYQLKRSHVYPVYDLDYPERLKIIKDYLNSFNNLFYIGRPGRFKYNNQDHSIEMGIAAAKAISTGIKPDFDLIGGESEYFEKGNLKVS